MTKPIGRLLIDRVKEAAAPRAARHVVEIYTRGMRITGGLEIFARRRLSDILNSSEQFLSLDEASFCSLVGSTYLSPVPVGTITINKRAIIFATPRVELEPAGTDDSQKDLVQVRKTPHRVLLHTPPFVVEGFIHLVREIHLQDALETSADPFVAITEAAIYSLVTPEAPSIERYFVSVNKEWITAVHSAS